MNAHDSAAQQIRTIERYGVDAQGFLDYDQVHREFYGERPQPVTARTTRVTPEAASNPSTARSN